VLVRPEQLRLLPADTAGGVPARVAEVSFYGHDAAVHLDLLPSGPRVVARIVGMDAPAPDDLVTIAARGSATVYRTSEPAPAPAPDLAT
jgi:iron(III) transport system ATP-binding protein